MDMLSLMHECARRGYLEVNGKPVSLAMLARMTGGTTDEVSRLFQELDSSGVISRTDDGLIFSRRMVRDEHKRNACREAGKRGGNPALMGGDKGGDKHTPKGGAKGGAKGEITPSSSSSSSSSDKDPQPPSGEFDRFWAEYPKTLRKADEQGCRKKWAKLKLDAEAARVLAGLRILKESPDWTKQGGQFIPAPMVFLNQRKWDIDMAISTGRQSDDQTRALIAQRQAQVASQQAVKVDMAGRVAELKALPAAELDRLKAVALADVPEGLRASTAKADPLGGNHLTTLISNRLRMESMEKSADPVSAAVAGGWEPL
jgi:hypothetical protein